MLGLGTSIESKGDLLPLPPNLTGGYTRATEYKLQCHQ